MQFYDVTVRFSRTIQVREYEPATAEVIVKAQLAEGEAADVAVAEGFRLVSNQVHLALGLPADTKLPKRNGKVETAVTGTPAAQQAKPAEATKPAQTTAAKPQPASDIPGDDIPDSAPATTQAGKSTALQAVPGDDIPDSAPVQQAQTNAQAGGTGEAITAAELSKWIGEQVRLGKVTSAAITGLYPKFGISRFADLKPEKCGEAKAAIEAIIGGTAVL